MDGVFGVLANVVWTNSAVCRPRLRDRAGPVAPARPVTVYGIDKFPRMVDYVVPTGVRIADADRVRLGAHLATGTTVMHEGFVNFNAGTLGSSMVEGRISAGVVVDDGRTSAVARRSWAPSPVSARTSSRSGSAACSAPTPGWASRWRLLCRGGRPVRHRGHQGADRRRARRSRPATSPARTTCSSAVIRCRGGRGVVKRDGTRHLRLRRALHAN